MLARSFLAAALLIGTFSNRASAQLCPQNFDGVGSPSPIDRTVTATRPSRPGRSCDSIEQFLRSSPNAAAAHAVVFIVDPLTDLPAMTSTNSAVLHGGGLVLELRASLRPSDTSVRD